MKQFFLRGGVPIVVIGFVLLGALPSSAVRVPPCPEGEERLGLTPTGVVTLDGFVLQRSTATGRFQTDGGLDFDVNTAGVEAVDPLNASCTNAASTVTLTVVDPFTGFSGAVGLVTP